MGKKVIELTKGYAKIDPNKLKQHFSEHLFAVLCAHSSYEFDMVDDSHDYGIDFRIKEVKKINGALLSEKDLLKVQVKSTSNWELKNGHISYPLKNKAYNQMVRHNKNGLTPLIVALLCLPDKQINWVEYNTNKMDLKRCWYWYKTDSESLKENQNSTTTIKIPVEQRFKLNTLTELIDKFQVKRIN